MHGIKGLSFHKVIRVHMREGPKSDEKRFCRVNFIFFLDARGAEIWARACQIFPCASYLGQLAESHPKQMVVSSLYKILQIESM